MEEKKKNSQKKKNTTNKKTNNNKNSSKKVVAKKNPTKKTAPKKTTTKQVTAKKEPKKEIKPVVEEVKQEPKKEPKKEIDLEKTIIFNNRQKRNLQEVVEKLEEETVVVEDKVIKRSKVRKILIIIVAVAMVLVFAASTAYVLSQLKIEHHRNETTGSNIYEKAKAKKIEPSSVKNIDEQETEERYEHIITISLDQFEKKAANKDEMIVLVASSSCGSCIQFEPDIEKVFAELDKEIYRLDIRAMKEDEINSFREYFAFTITPTIFVVKDGVVVADTARTGRMPVEDLKEWLKNNS